MGIYERDYTQADADRGPGALSGVLHGPVAVKILIFLNVGLFCLWLVDSPGMLAFMQQHFLVSAHGVLQEHRWHTLVTYALSHKTFWHILFNMFGLWYFGKEVEELYGSRNLLAFYVLTALVAAWSSMGFNWVRQVDHPGLGASGPVLAMAVITACYYPEREVYLFFAIPIRLKWLVLLYLLWDLLGLANPDMDRIAHAGHLGGGLAGYLLYKFDVRLFAAREEARTSLFLRIKQAFRRRPKLKLVEPREVERFERISAPEDPLDSRVDRRTATRVDELLQKISVQGIGALTPEEREFLKASSEKYRR